MTWHNIKAINLRRSRSERRPQRLVIMKKRKKAPSGNFMAAEASAVGGEMALSQVWCEDTESVGVYCVLTVSDNGPFFKAFLNQTGSCCKLFHHCVGMSTVALIPIYVCNLNRQHGPLQPYFKILFVFALSCQCVRADLLPWCMII